MRTEEEQENVELEDIILSIQEQRGTDTVPFMVDTDEKALWAGRKVLRAESRIAERERQKERYQALIDQWFDRATRDDVATIEFFRSILKPYVEATLRSGGKKRTLYLPGLALSLRKLPDKADVINATAAMIYCQKHLKEAIEVKKSLLKSALKDALASGECIPGVELNLGKDELYLNDETAKSGGKEKSGAAA